LFKHDRRNFKQLLTPDTSTQWYFETNCSFRKCMLSKITSVKKTTHAANWFTRPVSQLQ